MSEEEAVKKLINGMILASIGDGTFLTDITTVETIVNGYLREKARADKLEQEYSKALTKIDEYECDFISKDEIRQKIKELNDNISYLSKFEDWKNKEYTNKDVIENCIQVLEELLEEE